MDELLIVVLFSALTGVMIGSLGTVVIFWLCGALERKTVIEKVSPELRDATIQAEYTQATSDETSDFRQMHRAQTSSSYHLYIGTAERCYHLDRRCRCYPDWDNVKRGPTWYSAERSVTLHSFDFTKYRLWTSLFRRGTIVNGQIVVCSFDLTEYHL